MTVDLSSEFNSYTLGAPQPIGSAQFIEQPSVSRPQFSPLDATTYPTECYAPSANFPETRKQCNHVHPKFPNLHQLNDQSNFGWNYESRVGRDCCHITLDEREAQRPSYYKLSEFDPACQHSNQYADKVSEIFHHQKVYGKPICYTNDENGLIYSELNNLREINQLFTRPYRGHYAGAGQRSLHSKDLESALQQGILTNARQKPTEVTRGTTFYRYQHLPEFGNPQRVQHVVEPPVRYGGWIRGGDNTRDHVRRVDYYRRSANFGNWPVAQKPFLPQSMQK